MLDLNTEIEDNMVLRDNREVQVNVHYYTFELCVSKTCTII